MGDLYGQLWICPYNRGMAKPPISEVPSVSDIGMGFDDLPEWDGKHVWDRHREWAEPIAANLLVAYNQRDDVLFENALERLRKGRC